MGTAVWSVGVSGAGGRVRPLLLLAVFAAATLASVLCVTAVVARCVYYHDFLFSSLIPFVVVFLSRHQSTEISLLHGLEIWVEV